MRRMEAELPQVIQEGATQDAAVPGEQNKPPVSGAVKPTLPAEVPTAESQSDDVVHVGIGKAGAEDEGMGEYKGRVPPTLVEADAVNRNMAEHGYGKPGENLSNPNPRAHIKKGAFTETDRMRPRTRTTVVGSEISTKATTF